MERPWHKRALEFENESGDYADFEAWVEWYSTHKGGSYGQEILDLLDIYQQIDLYAVFCECFDEEPVVEAKW